MNRTKSIYCALFAVLLSPMVANADPIIRPISSAEPVFVDSSGRRWIEIFETIGLSWNDLAAVCDIETGECAGTLDRSVSFFAPFHTSDLDLTNVFWASPFEVAELFYEVAGLPAGSLDGDGRATFPPGDGFGAAFSEVFGSTANPEGLFFDGYARSCYSAPPPCVGQPLVVTEDTGSPFPIPRNSVFDVGRGGSASTRDIFGSWMYLSAAVPEPGTLALLGIGLFGMGLARRRKIA